MKAVVIRRYGPPDVLQPAEMPTPKPRRGQVLIRVRAASVNPIDWRIRSGSVRFLMPGRLPLVPGYDVAGEVAECGAGVESLRPGDAVFSFLDRLFGGGYAEFAVASQGVVVPKPESLSYEEAAAVPLAACTALESLVNLGRVAEGSDVLINGASGGVGTFAVQIAKALGARVTGVCGPTNLEMVAGLGADRVIDYTSDDFAEMGDRYDVVLDAVAKRSYPACRRVLKPGGCFVTTLPWPKHYLWHFLTLFGRRRSRVIMVRPNGDHLRRIAAMIEKGQVHPVIDRVLALEHASEAHRQSETGHSRGKLVLRVGETAG
jgi:NADPH:quinone reductase-like Zn-dependent oxidoreductase